MILLGRPKDLENYICVNSEQCKILCKIGFVPICRELNIDNIYFIKTDELEKVVRESGI